MKRILKHKEKIFILIIFIVASILRLWNLDKFPLSMTDDELREAFSAYSIFQTGRDVHGTLLPLTFNMERVNFGPVSIYISSLFFIFGDLGFFISRLPYALAGIGSSVLTYFFAKHVTKNITIAFISALTMAVSAWAIQISRFAYDPAFSMFFYLLGLNFFVRIKKNNYKYTFLALFFFILGFYSYAATKIIFLPFVLVGTLYKLKDLNKKQLVLICFLTIFTFLSFFYLDKTQKAGEYNGGAFFFNNNYQVTTDIELERRNINAPPVFETIFHNKVTYWFGIFNNHYLYAFSPQFLFLSQESNGIFSMWNRGELYLFESIFLILGFSYLLLNKRKELMFLIAMLFASALPSGLGSGAPTYVIRSELMIPFLYIFVGSGIFYFLSFFKINKIKVTAISLLILVYIYFLFGYLTQYYYEWVFTHSKHHSVGSQQLVKLLAEESKGKKVLVSGVTENIVLHYAFYNDLDSIAVQKILKSHPYKINNISFLTNCINDGKGDPKKDLTKDSMYVAPERCFPKIKPDRYIKAIDGEVLWKIYEK